MMIGRRAYGTRLAGQKFKLLPEYKLRCGLEIHTQLCTANKLFSASTNSPFAAADKPNYHTSYFDVSLPGTQPLFNHEVLLLATKLSIALNCDVNLNSQFDRKHYFYGDQPLGYQITQHYSPFASNGFLRLRSIFDDIDQDSKIIEIQQLQIEQDTGKSVYKEQDSKSLIDFNRSNVPLIEMVTRPDFTDLKQIRSFLKKYQNLVRHLGVSTGDLETGAMRVDVNISVNDYARVELKNLPNTSSIFNAIKFEYQRHVDIIRNGDAEETLTHSQTRGWNGSSTVKLRSKETTIDYRYMPDPELPRITLAEDFVPGVSQLMPELPDQVLERLMSAPYSLSLKDAKILTINSNSHDQLYTQHQLQQFYLDTFKMYQQQAGESFNHKLPTNWIIHELLGNMNKLEIYLEKVVEILPPEEFSNLLMFIHEGKVSKASAKLLLFHILNSFKESNFKSTSSLDLSSLIKEFELDAIEVVPQEDLRQICQGIIDDLGDDNMIKGIISGKKKNSLKYLVGQGMRLSQGRIKPHLFESTFKDILGVKW